jgi:lysophospholipase L1-like esterase
MLKQIHSIVAAAALSATTLLAGYATAAEPVPVVQSAPETTARPARIPHNFERWEKEIAAFEAADRANPPAKGGVLFIGSSTIRLWKSLAQDFPDHKVLNRGFGGSEIADATHFADRIIFPYEPRQIFLRAGGNDIHVGRLPEEVSADFVEFVRTVHARLPKTEIVFISVSPAPARWGQKDKNLRLNEMIRSSSLHLPHVAYVETYDMTLTADGHARPELFVADKLHFNADGYKLLADRVRPYLLMPR